MYVKRLPFVEMPMGLGVPMDQGEGPIGIAGPISQPRGTIDTVTHAGSYLCALSEPTLLWAAKGVLYLHVGGTVTHQAQKVLAMPCYPPKKA